MAPKIASSLALVAVLLAMLAPSAAAADLERLIAPTAVCADQTDPAAAPAVQEQAMRCMSNYAREHAGAGALAGAADLDRSAGDKSGDILRCDSFSHFACGREFTYWMRRVGYIPARCWSAAENIAWGTGERGNVRSIFRAWIHSPGHRENILGPYTQIGVGLEVGTLDNHTDVHVWTQHFGSHCDKPRRSDPPLLRGLADQRAVG